MMCFKRRVDDYARAHTKAPVVGDKAGGVYDNYRISRSGRISRSRRVAAILDRRL
jgi:hypothetical protein